MKNKRRALAILAILFACGKQAEVAPAPQSVDVQLPCDVTLAVDSTASALPLPASATGG